MRRHHYFFRFAAVAVCIALALPGCSTQSQRIGADDGSDVCRRQRVALDSTGDFFAEDIVKGAAIGAAIGGLSGLLAGRNTRSALLGGVAGGALGAAGGYWKARQQQASDQASLYRTISSDIQRDNASIDKTQLAFNQLVDCRRSEASRVRGDLSAGHLNRAQAQAAMAAVRERSLGDLRIAQAINDKIQERGNDFTFANNQLSSGTPGEAGEFFDTGARVAPRPGRPLRSNVPRPGTPAGEVQVATSTNLAKREQLKQSIVSAQANTSAFELL